MSEPRLRLYGFVPMTRRRYVFQLVVAGGLAAALLGAWWLRWPMLREEMKGSPSAAWLVRVVDAAPWLIGGACALQALEAWYVLRLFARKEAASGRGAPGIMTDKADSHPQK